MPTPIEIEHTSGDYWDGLGPITFKINTIPVNLTNAVIKMQIRKSRKATDAVLAEWSTEDQTIEIIDAAEGKFMIHGRVLDLPTGKLLSDVQVTPVDGKTRTIIPEIIWTVKGDVTR